ncbi:MAG: DHA2 family efflux MFS transporter permease subunit, partial [Propionibacteriaceae bacterium]
MPDLSPRRRQLVLAICCLSLFIVGLDVTIVNIALPSLRADLGTSVSQLQWVLDAYTLVLASLLILSGSTADRIGRRRVFQLGLALFTLGSLLCSVAPSLGWLIVFRMMQAVGGSMLNPVAMSIITNTFTEPRERARAIGVWGGVVGLSMALGPVLGGVLVAGLGWRSIFWINVPVGVAAIALAALFVPESQAERPRRLDPVGQILVLLVLASLTYGIIEGPVAGWATPLIVGCFILGAAALTGLLVYESRHPEPLLDPRFFRSVPFSGATLIAVCAFGALGGFLFLNSIYLQDVRSLSALHAGLYTLPMALLTAIIAPLSGRIVAARGPRLPLILAGSAIALAMLPLTQLTATTPVWLLFAAYALFGFGFGMVNAPITNTAVSGMPRAQAGVAAAIASTSR